MCVAILMRTSTEKIQADLRLCAIIVFCIFNNLCFDFLVHIDSIKSANRFRNGCPGIVWEMNITRVGKEHGRHSCNILQLVLVAHGGKVPQRLHVPAKSSNCESVLQFNLTGDYFTGYNVSMRGVSCRPREQEWTIPNPVNISINVLELLEMS